MGESLSLQEPKRKGISDGAPTAKFNCCTDGTTPIPTVPANTLGSEASYVYDTPPNIEPIRGTVLTDAWADIECKVINIAGTTVMNVPAMDHGVVEVKPILTEPDMPNPSSTAPLRRCTEFTRHPRVVRSKRSRALRR